MSKNSEIQKEFLKSLKCGTGRAYLLLKEYPDIQFVEEIYKGAVKNYAYDPQSEGSRARYIYKFVKHSKNSKLLMNRILQRLSKEKNNFWNLDQMCDLAVLFHKSGNSKAKHVLKQRFLLNINENYEFCGEKQLIKIYGLKGILIVAELIGQQLSFDKDDYEDSSTVDQFQKTQQHLDVYDVLRKEAKQNKFIEVYLKSILKNKSKPPRKYKKARYTYKNIKERIENSKFIAISERMSNDLSKNEVRELAKEFLNETDKQKKEKYLRIFSVRKFPLKIQPVFNIAKNKNPSNSRLVEFAVESLKFFKSPNIRKLALAKIKSTKNPCDYLDLLTANHKDGDHKLLKNVLKRSKNQDFIHSNIYGLISIYEANPTKKCKKPLEKMYHCMTCGIHRNDVLRILNKNNVLKKTILKEMKYDSDKQNRKLYHQIKNHGR